ncbi:hypothetical protein [Paractinoplanes lichenicola]|uniref:DUF4034 domain-containing protein n=1 Tax=Paractinoplanes lichenicola TaxID=2802976 RepID=A0ABS1VU42_9ACTN|nr:hypothetical protein [Actinoplanes lichenicola]MBL7257996.1 hypothetical protein [Actinoplanes lichenicola]
MPFFKKKPPAADDIEIMEFFDDEAEELDQALRERDWGVARKLLAAADREEFSYYVRTAADVPGLEQWLPEVIRHDPGDPLPHLLRGARAVSWAWEARGTGRADTVARETWDVWFQRLALAEDCLDMALERDRGLAEPWYYKITLGRARQLPAEERRRRFHHLVALDPAHFNGHKSMFEGLLPKWSGSWEAAFQFARDRTAACPGTHVPLLTAMAHLNFRASADNPDENYLERPEVSAEIVAAAQQSVWHDDYENTILTPELWNHFAYALAGGRYFRESAGLFDDIGDDFVRLQPWRTLDRFRAMRDWVRDEAADPDYDA